LGARLQVLGYGHERMQKPQRDRNGEKEQHRSYREK
jgi:hypothetical protein